MLKFLHSRSWWPLRSHVSTLALGNRHFSENLAFTLDHLLWCEILRTDPHCPRWDGQLGNASFRTLFELEEQDLFKASTI